jgi:cytidylate kinase
MKTVVAIDGPAASGKSSVAKKVSAQLGFSYVDSGAFYRAMTWWVLRRKADPGSASEVSAVIAQSQVESGFEGEEAFLRIEGIDPKPYLRDDDVNRSVSPVSVVPAVRRCLTDHLRGLARQRDVVVVGRDIGSVVFPDTPFKFYIDASQNVRQQRRDAEGQDDEIALRDRIDSSRTHAPLTIAQGAFVIDSTHLSVEGVADEMIRQLAAKGLAISRR